MKTRNKIVPAVYLFMERDGKILVCRRCNTGYADGYYQVPAGHIEAEELPTQAMIREAKEEVGIIVASSDLKFVHVSYRPKHDETGDRVDFFFQTSHWEGKVVNTEPHKCDDLRWVPPTELPSNTTPHVRNAIECWQKGIFFQELDRDFLKMNGYLN